MLIRNQSSSSSNSFMLFFRQVSHRLGPYDSCRVGEASHPGPQDEHETNVNFIVTNPTAIYQKTDLLDQLGGDVIALSENSATKFVQDLEGANFKKLGYRNVWGVAVPPQLHKGPEESKRGSSTGVSIHAKYPIREARSQEHTEWNTAGRYLQAFMRVAHFEIQICCLYGYPANLSNNKQKTNSLLQHAVNTIRSNTFPTIVCGDLNHPPDELEAMQELRDLGYMTTNEIFHSLYGTKIPPTFGTSTTNDVAIFSPELSSLVTAIWVDNQQLFPGHHPLGFTMTFPVQQPMRQTWRMPQSWIPFQPDPQKVEKHFLENMDQYESLHPLHAWAKATEDAVDRAMWEQNQENPERFPMNHLPRKCRGRCKPPKLVKQPHPKSVKKACDGQYTPQIDQPSMEIKHATRQLRRVQSLKHRMTKIAKTRHCDDRIVYQLHQEWTAILAAKGFHRSFQSWMTNFPELFPIPLTLPDVPFLHDVEQLLRFHTDAMVAERNQRLRQHAQYVRRQDVQKYGKQQAFQAVKPSTPGLVQALKIEKPMQGKLLANPEWGLVQLTLDEKYDLDFQRPVILQGQPAQIVSYEFPILELNPHDPIDELPTLVSFSQVQHTADPREVADALQKHWDQYWMRDNPGDQHSDDEWLEFQRLAHDLPEQPEFTVQLEDLETWKFAIKSLKSKTARGMCAWFPDELKMLPSVCIKKLAKILADSSPHAFPPWMMQAKTIPLAKIPHAEHPSATRPITILPLLYRLWGKMTTSQVLKNWSGSFPQAINGFLPGRSPTNFQYGLQIHLEAIAKKLTNQYLSGLTLDIIKAFNCLPRKPTAMLVRKLGVPSALVNTWMDAVEHMQRSWSIDSQIFPQHVSTTGYPEGDAWSVVGMLAVNAFWVYHASQITPRLCAFADNWGYSTECPDDHLRLIPLLQKLTRALRLQIDWKKTWAWFTHESHKEMLLRAKNQFLHEDASFAFVANARDLGYILHYKAQQTRATQRERHAQALLALKKLRAVEAPLEVKAQIARASGFSKALWGTSFYLSGQKFFEELRTEFARAMFGNHHNLQPYIACNCLLKHGIDPELFVIHSAIRTARHFLIHATEAQRQMFWRILRMPLPHASTIAGPVTALKQYTSRLDWIFLDNGLVQVTNFTTLDLVNSNQQDLLDAATDAWMEVVTESVRHRKHMKNAPLIDRDVTIAAFSKIPEKYQPCMGLEAAGGFMLNTQKAHFTEIEAGICSYCDQMDSHRHRVLECTATMDARKNHWTICDQLQDEDEIRMVFPLAYKTHEDQFLHDLLRKVPEPDVSFPHAPMPWVYTDGSCSQPTSKSYRWAAYAIVYPVVPHAILLTMTHLTPSQLLTKAFHVAAVSLVNGRQTINRAELAAAILTHEAKTGATVVTDSAYVLAMHDLIRSTPDVSALHRQANWDWLQRLHHLFWSSNYPIPICKVKAHQKIGTQCQTELIHILGNSVADEAAKIACKQLHKVITSDFRRLFADAVLQQQSLEAQFALRCDLAMHRVKLDNEHDKAPERQLERLEQMHSYAPEQGQTFVLTSVDFENARGSKFGRRSTDLVLKWVQLLVWPTSPEEVAPPVGITWVELAVNFMLCTQSTIPVQPHQESQGFTVRTNTFRTILMHIQYLVNKPLIPDVKPLKVKSLCQLGAKVMKQGLPLRPKLPLQTETLEILQGYFAQHALGGKAVFVATPHIPIMDSLVQSSFTDADEDNPKQRERLYRARRQAMKEANKA